MIHNSKREQALDIENHVLHQICSDCYYVDRVRYLTCSQLVNSAIRIDFYSREHSKTPDICLLARKLSHMPASTYPVPHPIQSRHALGFCPRRRYLSSTLGTMVGPHEYQAPPGRVVGACLSESDGISKVHRPHFTGYAF